MNKALSTLAFSAFYTAPFLFILYSYNKSCSLGVWMNSIYAWFSIYIHAVCHSIFCCYTHTFQYIMNLHMDLIQLLNYIFNTVIYCHLNAYNFIHESDFAYSFNPVKSIATTGSSPTTHAL